jgi:hypothetical protein
MEGTDMGGLIWLIIIFVIFMQIGKKTPKVQEKLQEAKDEALQAMQTQAKQSTPTTQTMHHTTQTTQRSFSVGKKTMTYTTEKKTQKRSMTDADREKLEAYRRQMAESQRTAEKTASKAAEPNDIVSRAKANSARYADKDETMQELEREHRHSEHVTPAGPKHADQEETKRAHISAAEPSYSLEESLLPSVEDLMVKGYDGNLSFERDFLGEAMDMISSYTL